MPQPSPTTSSTPPAPRTLPSRPPVRPAPTAPGRAARVVGIAAAAAAIVALLLDLVVAPPEQIQGQSQRLMYVHVPGAWTAFAAFAVVALASIAVLLHRGSRWDDVARAAAELGVGMTALAIVEGSIWGHMAWGTWWTWDPRLVSTALLLVLYVGYLAARALPERRVPAPRRAAVMGCLFFLMVPVVHMSVLWWRSLHQPPTVLRPDVSPPMATMMLVALLASVAAYSLAGAWFVLVRTRQLGRAR